MKMFNYTSFVLILTVIGTFYRFKEDIHDFPISNQFKIENYFPRKQAGMESDRKVRLIKTYQADQEYISYAKVRIEIAQNNTTYECAWDDSAWFPDYIDSLWNYDFNAFLVSLGSFLISWGDGCQDSVKFFNQSCSHVYTTQGHYMITVFSIYAFFNDDAVRTSGTLYQLKNLNFANCPNLHDTPVLTGLFNLQVLDLRATGITESPVTKNLTGLQYLYFNGTVILKPPDLTTNTNIRYLSFHGCIYLSVQPLVSKLTRLEHLDLYGTALSTKDLNDILYALCLNKHPNIRMVNLCVSHAVKPDASYISLFHAVYPSANLYTN